MQQNNLSEQDFKISCLHAAFKSTANFNEDYASAVIYKNLDDLFAG